MVHVTKRRTTSKNNFSGAATNFIGRFGVNKITALLYFIREIGHDLVSEEKNWPNYSKMSCFTTVKNSRKFLQAKKLEDALFKDNWHIAL